MSKTNKTVPVEEIQKRISYNNGNLYWKYREDMSEKWNARFSGKKIKTFMTNGYVRFCINYNGKQFKLRGHIVSWIIFNNKYPEKCLDHINKIRSDNRIENLRPANYYQNVLNTSPNDNKSSQYKGVFWSKNKWRTVLRIGGTKFHCGYFNDELEAALSYNKNAEEKHDTEYAYMNDISNGYTNKEYPNMPRHWTPEEMSA